MALFELFNLLIYTGASSGKSSGPWQKLWPNRINVQGIMVSDADVCYESVTLFLKLLLEVSKESCTFSWSREISGGCILSACQPANRR